MKQKVEMFTVKCDNCGKLFEDEYNGYSCWGDFNDVWENASESNWITEDGINHYCPECYSYDDNDNLVLKEIKNKVNLPPIENKEKEPKDDISCDVCGKHPACIVQTQFGRFCMEHARYV